MTLDQLISSVCDDLNRTDVTAQASDAVSMAIRQYDSRAWWFMESTHTFSTVAATAVYTLPTDARKLDHVKVRQPGGTWQQLERVSFSAIQDMLEDSASTGYPDYYAVYGEELYMATAPNGDYEAKLYYRAKLDDLSAGGSNAWTTDCADLIRACAAKTVAIRKMHDAELSAYFAAVERDEYVRLMAENDGRVSSGRTSPC